MIYWTYGIFDPRPGLCVYIGQTGNFERRKSQHLTTHRIKKKHPPGSIKTWLCQVHRAGVTPVILQLEAVQSVEESLISETRWVERFGRELSHPVRNLWDEHREIMDGRNGGTYDALIFSKDGPPQAIGRMVPNAKMTGFRFHAGEGIEITVKADDTVLESVGMVDFLPVRAEDDQDGADDAG